MYIIIFIGTHYSHVRKWPIVALYILSLPIPSWWNYTCYNRKPNLPVIDCSNLERRTASDRDFPLLTASFFSSVIVLALISASQSWCRRSFHLWSCSGSCLLLKGLVTAILVRAVSRGSVSFNPSASFLPRSTWAGGRVCEPQSGANEGECGPQIFWVSQAGPAPSWCLGLWQARSPTRGLWRSSTSRWPFQYTLKLFLCVKLGCIYRNFERCYVVVLIASLNLSKCDLKKIAILRDITNSLRHFR